MTVINEQDILFAEIGEQIKIAVFQFFANYLVADGVDLRSRMRIYGDDLSPQSVVRNSSPNVFCRFAGTDFDVPWD